MSIDRATVQKIANLARIAVPAEEEEALAKQLSGILGFVEQLSEVDTRGVQPMTSVARQKLPRRQDEVTDGGYAADLVANAPEQTSNFFVVPKVIE
jgi:aspartyl-tRNA(Asn)/glutamyl-tRNA(Gln) amidotransferase subunit C